MSRPMGQSLWGFLGLEGLEARLLSNTHKLANDVVSTQHVYKRSPSLSTSLPAQENLETDRKQPENSKEIQTHKNKQTKTIREPATQTAQKKNGNLTNCNRHEGSVRNYQEKPKPTKTVQVETETVQKKFRNRQETTRKTARNVVVYCKNARRASCHLASAQKVELASWIQQRCCMFVSCTTFWT